MSNIPLHNLEYLEREAQRLRDDPSGLLVMGRQPESRGKLQDALAVQIGQRKLHSAVRDGATRAIIATDLIIAAMEGALANTIGQVDA